jgi:hypothetical protein
MVSPLHFFAARFETFHDSPEKRSKILIDRRCSPKMMLSHSVPLFLAPQRCFLTPTARPTSSRGPLPKQRMAAVNDPRSPAHPESSARCHLLSQRLSRLVSHCDKPIPSVESCTLMPAL